MVPDIGSATGLYEAVLPACAGTACERVFSFLISVSTLRKHIDTCRGLGLRAAAASSRYSAGSSAPAAFRSPFGRRRHTRKSSTLTNSIEMHGPPCRGNVGDNSRLRTISLSWPGTRKLSEPGEVFMKDWQRSQSSAEQNLYLLPD